MTKINYGISYSLFQAFLLLKRKILGEVVKRNQSRESESCTAVRHNFLVEEP